METELLDYEVKSNKVIAKIRAKNVDCATSYFKGRFGKSGSLLKQRTKTIFIIKQNN